jgi:hypothetical protein
LNPVAVNFYRDRAVEQGDGDNEAEFVLELYERTFNPRERTLFNAHPVAFAQARPRF